MRDTILRYEAIEFFGNKMRAKQRVYHGLNQVMYFQKFTAYFNQPISTTTSYSVAQQFSNGVGIILSLKSGLESGANSSKIPKYLSVSWLSDFPNEDELLFYGDNVVFKIHDIIEGHSNTGHAKELSMLNEFQRVIQNQYIDWDEDNDKIKEIINGLCILIRNQQKINKDQKDEEEKVDSGISKYGQELFGYFCNHINTTSIGIKDYLSMTEKLKFALFSKTGATSTVENKDKKKGKKKKSKRRFKISLIPITDLFKHLYHLRLNDLSMEDMLGNKEQYIEAVYDYIQNSKDTFGDQLQRVTFQSESQQNRKTNMALQQLTNKYSATFNKLQWRIGYSIEFTNTLTHSLTFINDNKEDNDNDDSIENEKKEDTNAMVKCQWRDKLLHFIQLLSIDQSQMVINVSCSGTDKRLRRSYRIKEVNTNNKSSQIEVDSLVIIPEKEHSQNAKISINNTHDSLYELALFDPKNTDDPLSNCNNLNISIIKDRSKYPPQNNEYRPELVDIKTVFAVKDEDQSSVNIYWSAPSFCVGDISYRIIKMNKDTDDEKVSESVSITSLPYSLPLSLLPTSFRIITVVTIDGKEYQSSVSSAVNLNPYAQSGSASLCIIFCDN